jgi:hypothetical protein
MAGAADSASGEHRGAGACLGKCRPGQTKTGGGGYRKDLRGG